MRHGRPRGRPAMLTRQIDGTPRMTTPRAQKFRAAAAGGVESTARPPARVRVQAASTLIRRGSTCACFGIATSRTPFVKRALTACESAVSGRLKRR